MELKKSVEADLGKKRYFFLSIGLLLSLLLVTLAFEWRTYDNTSDGLGRLEDEFEEQLEIPLTQQPPPPPPPPLIPPAIIEVPDDEEIEEEVINLDIDISEDVAIEDLVYDEHAEDIDQVFEVVEENATPTGGMDAFYTYFRNTIRYPVQARRLGIEGKVYLRFVVERDGTLSGIEVLRGVGGGCDEEAVRVLKACPIKWKPGKQRGRPVRVHFSMPIHFTLN